MGHLDFGTMQRLNIEAARKHAGQSDLVTPSGPGGGGGGGGNNGGGVTPMSLNTPDILNSILNYNPFFDTPSTSTSTSTSTTTNLGAPSTFPSCSAEGIAGTPEDHEKKVFATLETPISSISSSSSTSTLVTNTCAAAVSGMGGPSASSSSASAVASTSLPSISISQPPSVELMRSKLIKEGLKHSIQSKRKSSGKGELDVRAELVVKQRKKEELTPEDEERRRRRRERNKIAATKCRNKKKEKTLLLIQESEFLEGNNISLKSEISQLESERQELANILETHRPVCSRILGSNTNIDNQGGGTSGGGGGGGGSGTRNLTSSHSMMSPQFSTSHHHHHHQHHQQSCYTSPGHTPHYSQFQGGTGGLPHHQHSYYPSTSLQLS